MDSSTAAKILAAALREDRLIALVGAGASAPSRDSSREYRGLLTPSMFIQAAAKRHSYVDASMSFTQACDSIYLNERRSGLEDELLRHYQVPATFEVPPAHRILSWLPFSSYVTSNFDQFIERSLQKEFRHHHVVIDSRDVTRLKRGFTPVIKYHGCVSRPASMVAASNDYEDPKKRHVLVRQLISVSLSSRTLLVIGHGLGDSDLTALLNEMLNELDDYTPQIFVIREPNRAQVLPNFRYSYEVVLEDLTAFLNRVLHEYRQGGQLHLAPFFDEAWVGSAFFAKLRHSFVLPSETQVIDAFLEHLADELGARDEVESVVADASHAVETALSERPNYGALRRLWTDCREDLTGVTDDVASAERVVRRKIGERERVRALFVDAGRSLVEPDSRILLYSQSQRVLQVLTGAPISTQNRCELFVGECRPKSPAAYQDAIAICQALTSTSYVVTICPDVVLINLIANGQITDVVMGTHAVYTEDQGTPYAFVNTCGSLAIAIAAERYSVPLHVIGERLKVEYVPESDAQDHLYAHQEHDLLEGQLGVSELSTARADVAHTNIGYDLVPVTDNVRLVFPDDLAG